MTDPETISLAVFFGAPLSGAMSLALPCGIILSTFNEEPERSRCGTESQGEIRPLPQKSAGSGESRLRHLLDPLSAGGFSLNFHAL